MDLTDLELANLRKGIGINGKPSCTYCGFDGTMKLVPCKFQLVSIESKNVSSLKITDMDGIDVAAIVCPKCGHVELFSTQTLSRQK